MNIFGRALNVTVNSDPTKAKNKHHFWYTKGDPEKHSNAKI